MVSQGNHLGAGARPPYRGRNDRGADVDPEAVAHRSSTENKPKATYTAHERLTARDHKMNRLPISGASVAASN
jgi:hypothetical protein